MDTKNNITVIGAGNGGQAIAAYSSMQGYYVCLYNRNIVKIPDIIKSNKITLTGKINGTGYIKLVTDNIETAVKFADIIMVVTTADAHKEIAAQIAPFLKDGQIIILNPGRTGGVFEFKKIFNDLDVNKKLHIGEAQTLMYACRIINDGVVNIIGIKNRVLFASINTYETNYILEHITPLFPCFVPAKSLIQTSLENIGAIFHPCITLFNLSTIERGDIFYFYRDITTQVVHFIIEIDKERLNIGKAFGFKLISAEEWISYAYKDIKGKDLQEKMKNNPAYYDILAPASIYSRQLLEDIPTGLVPMSELGNLANINVDLMNSIITICSSLLMIDFRKTGRTLKSLNLNNLSLSEVIQKFS
jgi:opine dehydrogenase